MRFALGVSFALCLTALVGCPEQPEETQESDLVVSKDTGEPDDGGADVAIGEDTDGPDTAGDVTAPDVPDVPQAPDVPDVPDVPDTSADPCEPNPCENGGICAIGASASSICQCPPGYEGTHCEIDIDECDPNPCKNGGTCTDGVAGFECVCTAGYSGSTCEDTEPCAPNPCLNDGLCIPQGNGFSCECPDGYGGDLCGTDIDDCDPNPCLNGGTCTDAVAGYDCECPAGFSGDQCEINDDECDPNPCLNGGSCTDGVAAFECACSLGWSGLVCDVNIDDCAGAPCANGAECIDGIGGATCVCPDGFAGDYCDEDVDDCSPNPCLNGGVCTDALAGFACACAVGWAGPICASDIDDCSPNPCKNGGACVDFVGGYGCECTAGWTGTDCGSNADDCTPNPCKNGGECSDLLGGFECACPEGYEGDSCGANVDECAANPCLNGGLCTDGVAGFTCECAPDFVGPTCAVSSDECDPNPCLNGGQCVDGEGTFTCDCPKGFQGETCGDNINECLPNPCQNAGTCVDGTGGFSCTCADGWQGLTCQDNANDCSPNPCLNGGTCGDLTGGFECSCQAGYSGETCATNIDDCAPNPCLNAATCTDGVAGFNCQCADGYSGKTCDTNVNDCAPNPCKNGGACVDGVGGFACECAPGFNGETCQTNVDDCDPNPCQNGGTCVDLVDSYTCLCADGWGGDTCGVTVDTCAPNPCQNGGVCSDEAGVVCACANGWTGPTCGTNINECDPNPCLNGGVCADLQGAFECTCQPGFEGESCDTYQTHCDPNPCLNGGLCTDIPGDFECGCQAGFEGATCETNVDDCDPNPCANGGQCVDQIDGFTCECAPGYEGPACLTNTDECASKPCLNGGTCTDGIDGFTCGCADGFEGTHCEIDTNECDPNPCENGGTCADLTATFSCDCVKGYEGPTCAVNSDDCDPNPCQNGGSCTDDVAGFSCDCPAGYDGKSCETNIDECTPNPCQNGGGCTDGVDTFTCACANGYEGEICAVNTDDCAPNPCQNGGQCTDAVAGFACACTAGFEGDICDVDTDNCTPNPCKNGAICTDAPDSFACACADGYEGETCETNTDDCAASPCQNGGQCTDGIGGFSCACANGWDGVTCEVNVDDCQSAPCLNGGSCADGIDAFTCTCVAGYEGETCSVNTDDCAQPSNPCQNDGTCTDGVNGYTCACVAGFEGKDCDVNTDDCDPNPCLNQGECSDGLNGFTCVCAGGYQGDTCAENIDECSPNPCLNAGVCTDEVAGFTCNCGAGFEGATCAVNIDECDPNPCLNGGTCADQIDAFECDCPAGFGGDTCQVNVDDCDPNPCLNGGTCADGVDGFECGCVSGYSGNLCQNEIDECAPAPCKNGGVCTDQLNGFTCSCPAGWVGATCEADFNECSEGACLNGAACTNTPGGFTCECLAGFDGPTCATNIDDCTPDPCDNDGVCADEVASFTCTCAAGFTGSTCQDYDCASLDCDDLLPCTIDTCTAATGCAHASTCADANGCTKAVCTPAGCTFPVDEEASCNSGLGCSSGVCRVGSSSTKDCDALGWTESAKEAGICVMDHFGDPAAAVTDDWAAANALCTGLGARLCTAKEAYRHSNKSLVWSNTPCSGGRRLVVKEHSKNAASKDHRVNCGTLDQAFKVVCCGDVTPTAEPVICDAALNCDTDICNTDGCVKSKSSNPWTCTSAPNVDCSDGDICTADNCSAGDCDNPIDPNACEDGHACTTTECAANACSLLATDDEACADDEIACTTTVCDGELGCVHQPNDSLCDDNDPCTADTCTASGCVYSSPCDDGVVCTTDTCEPTGDVESPFACTYVTNTGASCETSVDCSVGVCAEIVHSQDTCDQLGWGAVGSTGVLGTCFNAMGESQDAAGAAVACAEAGARLCTTEELYKANQDGEYWTGTPCHSGQMSIMRTTSTSIFGTQIKRTLFCHPSSVTRSVACCADMQPVTTSECVPQLECNDGKGCTDDRCLLDSGGGLSGPSVTCQAQFTQSCVDGLLCTDDLCDEPGDCSNPPGQGACDDNTACTVDTCSNETCANTPDDSLCDDGFDCSANTCHAQGCQISRDDAQCSDGVACTADKCVALNGVGCQNDPEPSGSICDDNDACTEAACAYYAVSTTPCSALLWAGKGGPDVCGTTPGGPCHGADTFAQAQSVCQELGGRLCTEAELAAGEAGETGCGFDGVHVWSSTPCEGGYIAADGNPGQPDNVVSECRAGTDTAAVRCCADADPVQAALGQCEIVSPIECDDGDFCTQNTCDSETGCGYPLDEGKACAVNDTCGLVACAGVAQSTKSCGQMGWPKFGDQSWCLHWSKNLGSCSGARTYDDAAEFCEIKGARLCTAAEVQTKTSTVGCSMAEVLSWTSDPCAPGAQLAIRGDGALPAECVSVAEALPTLCCADTAPTTSKPGCVVTASTCDDADACTTDLCTDAGCVHTPVVCNDGIVCTDDACDPETGCSAPLAAEGSACTTHSCTTGGCGTATTSTDSCGDLTWGTAAGSPLVCGEMDKGMGGCPQPASWANSLERCELAGARLCTLDEVLDKELHNTGCSSNTAMVWTGDACAPGAYLVVRGDGDLAQGPAICVPATGSYVAGCCADVEPAQPAWACNASQWECDDGDLCTIDSCGAAGCVYTAVACDDGNACTVDSCSGGTGDCIADPLDEGTACTDLGCVTGTCTTKPASAQTCAELGWDVSEGLSDAVCGESNAGLGGCSGDRTYAEAQTFCSQVGARLCSPTELLQDEAKNSGCGLEQALVWTSAPCAAGASLLAPGSDSQTPLECALHDGRHPVRCCADAAPPVRACTATTWSCWDGVCGIDQCASDSCTHSASCDDGDPCTVDSCVDGACAHEITSCDDGDPCTKDSCNAQGECLHPPKCQSSHPCDTVTCAPDGQCITKVQNGANCPSDCPEENCSGGDACMLAYCSTTEFGTAYCFTRSMCKNTACSDRSCETGTFGSKTCEAEPKSCNDGNPCTADSCNSNSGCVHAVLAGSCSDSDACTSGDQCQTVGGSAETCGGLGWDPQHGNNADVCASDQPGGACVEGKTQGEAESLCAEAGARLCTLNDLVSLEAKDVGACGFNSQAIWTSSSCGSGFWTAHGDGTSGACQSGGTAALVCCADADLSGFSVCVGGPAVTCDDGTACTADICAPATGCQYQGDHASCSDGNDCTQDLCESGAGCVSTASGAACDDGLGCTESACVDPIVSTSTCDTLSWGKAPEFKGSPLVCGSAQLTSGCGYQKTWADNKTWCENGGARMCTLAEVQAQEVRSTGCGVFDTVVWTASPCDGGHYAMYGQGTDQFPATCISDDETRLAVCCGDVDPSNVVPACIANTGASCNDGVACTLDYCDLETGCVNEPDHTVCEDNNDCSTDACTATGCTNEPTFAVCDDGLACTSSVCGAPAVSVASCLELEWNAGPTQVCGASEAGGACSGTTAWVDAAEICEIAGARLCTLAEVLANETAGTGCNYDVQQIWTSTPCDDGYYVAAGSTAFLSNHPVQCKPAASSQYSRCCADVDPVAAAAPRCLANAGDDCNDNNPCTLDVCDVQTGCMSTLPADVCSDNNACTLDECDPVDGSCDSSQPVVCDDGDDCTEDSCDTQSGCTNAALVDCDDGIPCTLDLCDPVNLSCTNTYPDDICADPPALDSFEDNADLGLTMTGGAFIPVGPTLHLEGWSGIKSGAAWWNQKVEVSDGFTSSFRFQISTIDNKPGAIGMAFVVQNASGSADGQAIGLTGAASSNQIVVWFDSGTPDGKKVHIRNATTTVASYDYGAGQDWADNTDHDAVITYSAGKITVNIDGTNILSDVAVVNNNAWDANGRAWVGFTAKQGGSPEGHKVKSWTVDPVCIDVVSCTPLASQTDGCATSGTCRFRQRGTSTCKQLGWTGGSGSNSVCAESDINGSCSNAVNYNGARAFCEDGGGRLCSIEELLANEAAGSGCSYDAVRVWSSSPCAPNRFWTAGGWAGALGDYPVMCTSKANSSNKYARCCADETPFSTVPTCHADVFEDCNQSCQQTTCNWNNGCGCN